MRLGSILLAAAALLLGTGAWAEGATGRDWDDSHMRTRHHALSQGVTRPDRVEGNDRFHRASHDPSETPGQVPPETLTSVTQNSWALDGKQSHVFGRNRAQSTSSGFSSTRGADALGAGRGGTSRGASAPRNSALRQGAVRRGR